MKVFFAIIIGLLVGYFYGGTLFEIIGSGILAGLFAKMLGSKYMPKKGEPGQPLLTEAERNYLNRSHSSWD
jgi:hypothetical protein